MPSSVSIGRRLRRAVSQRDVLGADLLDSDLASVAPSRAASSSDAARTDARTSCSIAPASAVISVTISRSMRLGPLCAAVASTRAMTRLHPPLARSERRGAVLGFCDG